MEFSDSPLVRWVTNIRDYGLEFASKRFYSLYGAEVADNSDTTFQGRIRAKVAALGFGIRQPNGDFDTETFGRTILPSTIYAGKDHGVYFPPEIGDRVWVSFDHGDPVRPDPSYQGSYWTTTDPSVGESSALPAEFRKTAGAPKSENGRVVLATGSPLVRGIKTRFGHGLIFSDDEALPYVMLWSGKQVSPGEQANRKQQIVLADESGIPPLSDGRSIDSGIYLDSFYGHRIALNDKDQSITISGKADPGGEIAHSIKIEDRTGKITIKTKLQQVVTIDDGTRSTSVTTPGTASVMAAGGVSLASGTSPPVVVAPPGTSVETGAGAKISNFLGAVIETIGGFHSQTIAGASTQTLAGALTQNVAGVMTVTAASLNLTAALINFLGVVVIGNPLTARTLANDYLIDFVLNHEHETAVPGPPSKPSIGPLSTIVNPGNPLPPITLLQYGTTTLKAT